jgi:hypothetical protein
MSNIDEERAAQAHRHSFRLITEALLNPETFEIDRSLSEILDVSNDPPRTALDLIHSLVWQAAGAVLTIGETTEGALDLVRRGALMQEIKYSETNQENGKPE